MSSDPQYLLRFDDICPTMNWRMWDQIEEVLQEHRIRPILAVVPDNQDPRLCVDPPREDFWERVRQWQGAGWTIALHGYQHVYVNHGRGIMGLTPQSEFAGLPPAEQARKLAAGAAIFAENGVKPEAWIAPSHSFDRITVKLLPQFGIKVISDGLWHWPHTDKHGITWVPQQMWSILRRRERGTWTACFHHDAWTAETFAHFRRNLAEFAGEVTTLGEMLAIYAGRHLTLADRLAALHDLLWNHRCTEVLDHAARPAGRRPFARRQR